MLGFAIAALVAVTNQAIAQTGGVTHIDTVAAPSLRPNLLGDPERRAATVYLPPSYSKRPLRRYPVVYLLHGFAADHRAFMAGAYQNLNIRISMDSLIRAGAVREMIVVTPSARNAYEGSFYVNSTTTGNWEDFIARDLVSHMDRKYRTVRSAQGRGLAGHSMGGYGALHVGMRHPETFSSIYALSACCLASSDSLTAAEAHDWRKAIELDDRSKFLAAGFIPNIYIALAAVYSPNPSRPPFFVDLPYRIAGDSVVIDSSVASRWRVGPLMMAKSHAANLARLNIAFDAGDDDGLRDIPVRARELDALLTELGIPHAFDIYEGTHGNRIRARIEQKALPFFSKHLTAEAK